MGKSLCMHWKSQSHSTVVGQYTHRIFTILLSILTNNRHWVSKIEFHATHCMFIFNAQGKGLPASPCKEVSN